MAKGFCMLACVIGCLLPSWALAQVHDPDVWQVFDGDPMEGFVDASLFEGGNLPMGIEEILDRQGDVAVVRISSVEGLVDRSCHVLDWAGGKAYHIRPMHRIASAVLSPDGQRIAAVLEAPIENCLVVYGWLDGTTTRMEDVQATAGSVSWVDDTRLAYLPADGSNAPLTIDLDKSGSNSLFAGPTGPVVQPNVYCCGGVCDDCVCGGNNPYPCCSNGGNCTWWAWHKACCGWGRALPGWGDAHSWVGRAQSAGYPITGAKVGTIGCDYNGTFSSYGHVAWVEAVSGGQVKVSEQGCWSGYGWWYSWYNASAFDGYINNPYTPPPTPDWDATYNAQSFPSSMTAGTTAIVWAEYVNKGTQTWAHSQVYLGTSSPQDRSSPFCNTPNWPSCTRATDVDQSAVTTNNVGRFTFILKAPTTPGTYVEKYRLVREGVTWFGGEVTWTINVVAATGNLTGIVTNASTSAPIAGATVTLAGVGSKTTNASGSYTFSGVNAGNYTASVSATGYNGASSGVSITAGSTTTKHFALTPSDTQAPSVPTDLAGTATGPTSVQLTWTASTDNVGVAGYDIRRNGSVIGSSATTSFTDTGATPDATVSYDVRARDAVPNYSAYCSAIQVTTPPAAPTVQMVFQDGFNGNLDNWVQQVQGFAYSTTVNRGGITGGGAAFMGAGESDQMYRLFSRPFAQLKARAYFWDGKGGWKPSVCGWAYRSAMSVRDRDGAAKVYIDNEMYNAPDNSKYYYRLVGAGGASAHTAYATRDANTDCAGTWVCFETEVSPAGGTFTARVTDRSGTQSTTQGLTSDFFSWGIGRITLGLGVTSSAEAYWDDVTFEALPPARPTMGTATALSDTEIRWNFTPADANHFAWEVMDSNGTVLSPVWPNAGWLDHNATSWTETGLAPNTVYTRKLKCWNGTLDSSTTPARSACTMTPLLTVGCVTTASTGLCLGDSVTWTAPAGFGPGKVEYFKYAWDQNPTHTFTGSEPIWSSDSLALTADAVGLWYLHVQAFNGDDVAHDTFDTGIMVENCNAPNVVAAVSRKAHGSAGSFDIDVSSDTAVESRLGGPTQILVTFSNSVIGDGELDANDIFVTSGTVTGVSVAENVLTIQLSGATNGEKFAIGFPGIVSIAGNYPVPADQVICFGVLAGDTNANGAVNVFDLVDLRNKLNEPTTAVNAYCDVTGDGVINVFDLVAARNNLNTNVVGMCP